VAVTAGAGDLATTVVGYEASVANGVTDRDIELNIASTGFRLRDVNAGTDLATVLVDMTTAMQFKVYLRENLVEVYYKRPSSVTWTLMHSGTLTNAGAPSAAGHARWGHITAGTVTSQWRWLQLGWGYGGQPWNSSASSSTSHNVITGKRITILPYPLATFATAGTTYLAATRGPGRYDETHTIEVAHDYGIERAFTTVSPSMDEEFRTTTDADDVELVFEPAASGLATSLGSRTIVLGFFNSNVANAFLEAWDGGAWVTLGEYDPINLPSVVAHAGGVFNGQGTVDGDQVYPRLAGTAEGSRYVQAGEAIGCDIYVNGTLAKVLDHEEGHWTEKDTRRCRFTVDRAVSSGLCFLVPKNGVLVVHNVSTSYTKFRVRIPGATTADGYFRMKLFLGGLSVAGLVPSDGWAVDWDPIYREDEDERGTTRRFERAPLRRQLTMSWSEGVPLGSLRSSIIGASAILPNYYSADATHEPLAAQKDVPWLLAGAMRRSKSGQLPWLIVKNVPITSTYKTITDQTLFMLARPESPVSFTQVRGTPGEREFVRVQQFSFKEVR
jgi:hypothetical protein